MDPGKRFSLEVSFSLSD